MCMLYVAEVYVQARAAEVLLVVFLSFLESAYASLLDNTANILPPSPSFNLLLDTVVDYHSPRTVEELIHLPG